MKIITETAVALYYRRPKQEHRQFICVCESGQVANEKIHQLREEFPDLYPEPERFEDHLIHYVRRAY